MVYEDQVSYRTGFQAWDEVVDDKMVESGSVELMDMSGFRRNLGAASSIFWHGKSFDLLVLFSVK